MEQVHTNLIDRVEEKKQLKRQSSLFYAILLDINSAYDCTISAKTKKELAQAISKAIEADNGRKICGIFKGTSIAHRPTTKIELL